MTTIDMHRDTCSILSGQEVRVHMKKIFAFAALAVATFAGAAFAADAYSITTSGGKGKAKENITTHIKITSQDPYHINKEFSHKVTLTTPDGVAVENAKVKGSVDSDTQLTFVVVSKSEAAGKKEIKAEIRFAVCTETTCEPKTETRSLAIEAQ